MTEHEEIIIPSSEEDRAAIKKAFDEISNAKHRQKGEASYINETLKSLSEKYGIKTKHLRKWANAYHNDSFDKAAADADAMESARILILKQE